MNFLEHDGLYLPIYDGDNVLKTKEEFKETPGTGKPFFVRLARTSGPNETLKSRLERADWYFNRLAELCQIKVVRHKWGVCEDDPSFGIDKRLYTGNLPAGYLLVAKVATIQPVGEIPDDIQKTYEVGHLEFISEVASDPDHLGDTRIEQVVYGPRLGSLDPPQAWHVDIDPLVGKQKFPLPDQPGFTNVSIQLG